jgi:hypothetical protein
MFERISRGWELTKQSAQVLKADKELLVFPLVSGLACLAVVASFLAPVMFNVSLRDQVEQWVDERSPVLWVVLFLFYFINYFILIFFNSAMVACAIVRFRGGDPNISTGLSAAGSRLPQIFGWALVSATVGMLLNALERNKRGQSVANFVSGILGTAWTVMTYFVVPVLVVEKLGPFAAIKRSVSVVRDTWGEALTSNFGIGVIVFLANIPGILALFGGGVMIQGGHAMIGIPLIVTGVVWMIVVGLVSSALTAISQAGLYLYAADGEVPRGYDADAFRHAFSHGES